MTRFPLLLAAALLLAGCATPPALDQAGTAAPAKVVLAIQPTDNADAIMEKATEMERFLEARMKEDGVEADVEIIVPLTSTGVVEALRFGHADAALMSAWPATMASKRAGAEVVLAEMREVAIGAESQVAPYYYSYYVVLKDSPYQTLDDVKGRKAAYPSSTSTSGYVFPVAKLVQEGLVMVAAGGEADPRQHFGQVQFAGGYAQAWEALRAGQVDVAVTAGDINAKLYGEVRNGTRVIAEQGPVPSHGVVFAKDFAGTPEGDALKSALLDLKGEHKDLMRKLVSGIFVEFKETTTEEHVAGLAGALNATGIKFNEKLG